MDEKTERVSAVQDEHIDHRKLREHVNISADFQGKISWFMLFFVAWIGLSGWVLNFDLGYTGTVLQMLPFRKSFGHCAMVPASEVPGAPKGAGGMVEVCQLEATAQSIGSSIYILFMGVGAAITGPSGHYLGRKRAIQLACLIIIVGAAGMLGTAGNYTNYVVCKCIGAVGIGQLQTLGPIYGVECTPPNRRGFLIAFFSVSGSLGAFLVALVCLGSSHIAGNWSWKTPIVCQIPVSVIYATVIMAFPESPRWLLLHGRVDEAHQSFGRLYGKQPDSDDVRTQIREIQEAVDQERVMASTSHWTEIFHKKSIRRTITATVIPCGASLSGGLAIFTYAAIFLSGIGIKNPFVITVCINACIFAGSLVGPFTVEFLGRRVTIIAGFAGMATCMLIFAVVGTVLGPTNPHAQKSVIGFLCIWAFLFGGFIASTMWLASAEMHSVRLRSYGQAFSITVNDILQFGVSFWTPYMINAKYGNWGPSVGYFYFSTEVLMAVVTFFLVPENARLTLEQVDDFFDSGRKAWKTSLAKNKMIARSHAVQANTGSALDDGL